MTDILRNGQYSELKSRFDSYYEQKLLPLLQENDKIRRRYFLMFVGLLLMALVLYPLLIIYVLMNMGSGEENNAVGAVLGASGFLIMVLGSPIYFFKKRAKEGGIMKEFADFFGTFEYRYECCLPDALISQSELFKKYNTHFGDDFFCGEYKNVGIIISEERLQNITYDNKNNRRKKKIFNGICILLTMNKNFKGRTVVLEDKGILNVFKHISGLERVKLEDIQFEKLFEVYASDQIEARYLLTTAFMERILKLRDLYQGKSIQFSFKDNQLLVAIPTKQDMFEACSFFKSNVNKKKIDRVFDQFYAVFSIVDILKLNQNIGM